MKRKEAIPLIEKRISETKWLTYEDINIEDSLFKRFRKAVKPVRLSVPDLGEHIIRLYHRQPVELVQVPGGDDELMGQIEAFLSVRGENGIPIYLVWLNGQGWVSSEEWFPLFHLMVMHSERN